MKSKNFGYIPALDHLRGFAALLVLYFHGLHYISHKLTFGLPYDPANWPQAANPLGALVIEGHTAVSLFFVLSGFVFTAGSLDKRLHLGGFYQNRFLRTYPLFLFFLLLGMVFYPGNIDGVALAKTLFFMANDSTAFVGGPFTFVFWSVAVEWQFYLLFPFLLMAVQRWGWQWLPLLIAALLLMRFAAWQQGVDMQRLSYWTIGGRLDQFLIGMLAGIYYRRVFTPGRNHDQLALAGVALVLISLLVFNRAGGGALTNYVWVYWPTLEAVAWAVFLLGYLSVSRHFNSLISQALVGLGTISYSIYLVHYVVLEFFMARDWDSLIETGSATTTALLNTFLFIMPAVILVSTLTYQTVERPFLRRRKAYVERPTSIEGA